MPADVIRRAIEGSEFLSNLSPSSRDELLSEAVDHEMEDGAVLIEQGAAGDAFYILRQGRVRVSLVKADGGEPEEIAVLGPGAVVGEISMITDRPRTATCTITGGPARVIRVGKADLDRALRDHPDLRDRLHRLAFERARETMRRLYS